MLKKGLKMKTLGLDLGTNSIGWAIIERQNSQTKLLAKGVQIFEKGVGEDKNNEYSLAAERTGYRSARRLKFRRKLRKLKTLKVLKDHDFCPGLNDKDLEDWKYHKKYPLSSEFRNWLQTKEAVDQTEPINPYYFRWLAVTQKLNLDTTHDRYRLGRALYHLAQRRGYKSNRISGSEKDGAVNKEINKLQELKGNRTLGQYYYEECLGNKRIRGEGHYTSRKDYKEEFDRICEKQQLDSELRKDLYNAIFYQRPLKSQKGTVGKCLLESNKPRAPISYPLFEQFRALQFLNNIRVRPPRENIVRPLNDNERLIALKWIYSRKKQDKFDKLAKKITPKKAKLLFKSFENNEDNNNAWTFNYRKDTTVSPCPTISRLSSLFGDNWQKTLGERYKKAAGKTQDQIISDIWHAMFSFDSPECLKSFAEKQLGLNNEDAQKFAEPLPQGYASLSLKAIKKILPYLEKGLIYSHAVFMANMPTVLALSGKNWQAEASIVEKAFEDILAKHHLKACCERVINNNLQKLQNAEINTKNHWSIKENIASQESYVEKEISKIFRVDNWLNISETERRTIVENTASRIREQAKKNIDQKEFVRILSIEDRICHFLADKYKVGEKELKHLYHPSAIETYPAVQMDSENKLRLGSPRIASIKNPVFMRTMHRLRCVVNALLDKELINQDTRIRLEMARDLNTTNERAAIYRWQRDQKNKREEYREAINQHPEYRPASDSDILKYQLWEEQEKRCVYTNKTIALSDFLGNNPVYDIEHTIPRSLRLDNSQSNLTLCDRQFNREVKRNRIPQQLENSDEILNRAIKLWGDKIKNLEVIVEKKKAAARAAGDMETKNKARANFHYYRMQSQYWKNKLDGFKIKEAPEGFTNNQLVDTRIICKYAMLYLKSLFSKVYSIKASALADIKKVWGLEAKSRDSHIHHCIDALTVACLSPKFCEKIGEYFHKYERYEKENDHKPNAPEPWLGFAQYMNEDIGKDLLIVHHHKSKLLKQTFKKLRKRGKILKDKAGKPKISRGNSARGQLHEETNYGKIILPHHFQDAGEKSCVIRRKLTDLKATEFDKIVDPVVRAIVIDNKEAIGKKPLWFNKDKGIEIKTVRVIAHYKPEKVIPLTEHRDVSKHDHKRHRYVSSGNNYITALYRGKDKEGNIKGDWKLISNYDAVKASRENNWDKILPEVNEKGYQLKHILKSGTQVLFYQNSPDELKKMIPEKLNRRLYYVAKMNGSRITFNHHKTALSAKDLGNGVSVIDWTSKIQQNRLLMSVNNIKILVEGADFILSPLGIIEWL